MSYDKTFWSRISLSLRLRHPAETETPTATDAAMLARIVILVICIAFWFNAFIPSIKTCLVEDIQFPNLAKTADPYNTNGFGKSTLRFFFVVGLEGTGHHLMESIANGSPDIQFLQSNGWLSFYLGRLHRSLYNAYNPNRALFSAHLESPSPMDRNLTTIQRDVASLLRQMEVRYANVTHQRNPGSHIHVPLNTVGVGSPGYGMASYPNFHGTCRDLQIPSLDLLYKACDLAGVDCGHVFIYRKPIEVLLSTTVKRQFNTDLLKAMFMYKSQLNIIISEMYAFPGRNWGCYNLFDNTLLTSDATARDLAHIWGWSNVTAFQSLFRVLYEAPTVDNENATQLMETGHTPFLDALLETHARAVSLCKQTMRVGLLRGI